MKHEVIQTSAADMCPPFNPRRSGASSAAVRRWSRRALHFVEGRRGASMLLLPGWPQSWYAWRYVMPLW